MGNLHPEINNVPTIEIIWIKTYMSEINYQIRINSEFNKRQFNLYVCAFILLKKHTITNFNLTCSTSTHQIVVAV